MSNSNLDNQEFLTPGEVAAILRQKPDFVRSLVKQGLLRGIAIGGPQKKRILVPKQALDEYLKQAVVVPPREYNHQPRRVSSAKPVAGYPILNEYLAKLGK